MQNNIALLETDEPMKLDMKKSKPIDLPRVVYDPPPNSTVLVSGWGVPFAIEFKYTNDLYALNFTVANRSYCRNLYKKIKRAKYITEEVFCAGGPQFGEACLDPGDEGDPAVQKNESGVQVLAGVATYPPWYPWETRDHPNIFTRVGSFVEWLIDVMDKRWLQTKSKGK